MNITLIKELKREECVTLLFFIGKQMMIDHTEQQDWQEILQRIASIREQEDYSTANIDFIQEHLLSPDDRIRAGAALASSGCVFQPQILDILCEIAENDSVDAIRKASLQSLGLVIHEGVLRNFESGIGADTKLEFYEEWDELQTESLHEDYLRIKNLIFSMVQDDLEFVSVREAGLLAISDLGFLTHSERMDPRFYINGFRIC